MKMTATIRPLTPMRLRRSGPCRAAPRHLLGPISPGSGRTCYPIHPCFGTSRAAYSKDALCRAFRKNLVEVLPGDKRKLMDFRRSGAVEAHASNVDPIALATKMANSINQSKMLQDTYLPKRATTVRLADEARKRGRTALRKNES
jgi:hypothetical protein